MEKINIYDELLRQILDTITIVDDNFKIIGGTRILEFERHLSLLFSELMSDNDLKMKLNHIRYSFGSINNILHDHVLISTFKELKENNEYSFLQFKDRLDNKLNEIKSKIAIQKFELFYPINISTTEKIDSIKYGDIEINILDFSEIKEKLESKDVSDKFKQKFEKNKYKYISIPIWARNINYANEICAKYANLILGLIVNFQNYGESKFTIIGGHKPLTELKLLYLFVFNENKFLNYYFDEVYDDINIKLCVLEKKDVIEINKLIELIQKADKKVEDIIIRAINCYYLGMSEKRIRYSFLNFWTTLEILCLKNKSVRENEVIERLKSILIDTTPLEEHKIDRLYSLRNNLVHNADYDKIDQYDRALLKNCVEQMMDFFILNLSKYDFSKINSIFYFLHKSDADLIKDKELIDFVINLRDKNKND